MGKLEKLFVVLKNMNNAAVAFSGGVDSSFLLAAAVRTLGDKAAAILVDSPALPRHELQEARAIASSIGASLIELRAPAISPLVKSNPPDRCYHCKKEVFSLILAEAKNRGFDCLVEGSNTDDLEDYRPGKKALTELGVRSPLLEAGFSKHDVRREARALGLPIWDKPAYACLYSRIPYGQEIKPEDLKKVELAENFLKDQGFRNTRVRCHGDLARIEVAREERSKLLDEPVGSETVKALKSFGFTYVSMDIQGYRMGSLNEAISS